MVKKTAAEKQKKKKTDVQYDKTHRTRCSPSEVAKTYKDLGDQKRALVHEMGFGVLAENMSNYKFSNLIMMELADSFHILDSTIRTNVGKFKIDATKVGHAFGLNAQGRLYRHKVIEKQVIAAQYEVVESFRKKTLADLRDMVYTIPLESEENITKFKRAFILYVQKALFVGVVERRSKRRHKNLNANAVPTPNQPVIEEDNAANEDVVQQPHQNAEEDNNAAAATDAVVGPSSQLTPTFLDKDVNPGPVPTDTRDIVPESDARDTASVVGAAIEDEGVEEEDPPTSVEEETALPNLVQKITTQQHDHDAAGDHFQVEKDPATRIEKEMPFANIVQNITTQQHNDVLEDIQHADAAIVEKEIALTPLFQNIPTQQHNDVLEDIQHDHAAIVEKEITLTPLFRNITTEEHMPQEKQLEESVNGPELTMKDLALKGTVEHDTTSEITVEKPLIAEEISKR
ncbi:hypothetical protein PIB30_046298 [Stylosanthes scabra]|uniref:Uncharacterized protein n=1 Tax=Stylosanthes scabra TaxID=79078 RepID=A0ABU6RGG7_9FABA|nr:hypothetical protein [Stylosanthes scabra]